MCTRLHITLKSLKSSAHNIKQLDQILTQTITTGLLHTTPIWNCILRAYSKTPKPIKAILIYNHYSQSNSMIPDNFTFPSLLKACTSLNSFPKGKELHAHIIKVGLDCDVYVQNSLIHFYGSTGCIDDARFVFDKMSQRDITSWNSLLGTYNSNSVLRIEALVLFKEMICDGVGVDAITLVIILSALAEVRWVEYGSAVHGYMIKVGLFSKLNLENSLLGMYVKFGKMNAAMRLFDEMSSRRDVVSYTILINRPKRPSEALELFKKMENETVKPDETTLVSVLVACASLSNLQYGRLVHRLILRNDMRHDVFVGTALIDMYCKCGSLDEAMVTFYKMVDRDVFTWTTAIEGLANYGCVDEALKLFNQMENHGINPNEVTFVSVLTACRQSGLVDEGCFLLNKMVKIYNIQPKVEHFGCLVDLLSRAGMVHQAKEFIKTMPPGERLVAYKTLLGACISYSKINLGLEVADELIRLGSENLAVCILLSNLYALAGKWSKVEETRRQMKKLVW
ncbi:Pentatricopeptide repeat-containing protein [Camellia lanceoleosa]|uniref:Pentatricopeptide repeat-containing protein n=1 Tax=Camellia lanceoleosa TaxID=1840588 RepID=A0ACC0GHM3_9ERIC|nr:Pentatricopeptide repeat-containing protein [Camellia lanceoleosa]